MTILISELLHGLYKEINSCRRKNSNKDGCAICDQAKRDIRGLGKLACQCIEPCECSPERQDLLEKCLRDNIRDRHALADNRLWKEPVDAAPELATANLQQAQTVTPDPSQEDLKDAQVPQTSPQTDRWKLRVKDTGNGSQRDIELATEPNTEIQLRATGEGATEKGSAVGTAPEERTTEESSAVEIDPMSTKSQKMKLSKFLDKVTNPATADSKKADGKKT